MAPRSKDSSPKVTRFFKPIIGDDCDKFMLLPPFFARKMEHMANRETTEIEDCNGQRWSVTYSYVNNCLAFDKGWQKFYIDHDLKEGQLLVFEYIEGTHFVVHIFGTSAEERVDFDNGGAPQEKRSRREEPVKKCHNYESHSQRVSTCIDEEDVLNCMINREYRVEDRSFVNDLSKFENVSNTNMASSHIQVIETSENLDTETVPSPAEKESNLSPCPTHENTEMPVINTNQASVSFADVAPTKSSDKGSLSKDMSDDVSKLRNGKCRRNFEDVSGRPKESFDAGKRRTRRRKCNEIVVLL